MFNFTDGELKEGSEKWLLPTKTGCHDNNGI